MDNIHTHETPAESAVNADEQNTIAMRFFFYL